MPFIGYINRLPSLLFLFLGRKCFLFSGFRGAGPTPGVGGACGVTPSTSSHACCLPDVWFPLSSVLALLDWSGSSLFFTESLLSHPPFVFESLWALEVKGSVVFTGVTCSSVDLILFLLWFWCCCSVLVVVRQLGDVLSVSWAGVFVDGVCAGLTSVELVSGDWSSFTSDVGLSASLLTPEESSVLGLVPPLAGSPGDVSTTDDPASSPTHLALAALGREETGLLRNRSVCWMEMKHEAKPALFWGSVEFFKLTKYRQVLCRMIKFACLHAVYSLCLGSWHHGVTCFNFLTDISLICLP